MYFFHDASFPSALSLLVIVTGVILCFAVEDAVYEDQVAFLV
jgi:hypothetical protein